MNPKTTIGLVATLVVAVLGVWWANSSSSTPDQVAAGPKVLFEPAIGTLKTFEVSSGGGPVFKFELDGPSWKIVAPYSGTADQAAVNGDANKIKTLEYVRAYPKDHPDCPTPAMTSLANPIKTVKLTDETGKSYGLKIGARQQLSTSTYVQKEGDDTVYLVKADLNAELKKNLADYRGKLVTQFSQVDAVRVELTGEQNYTLVKNGARWTVASPIIARADANKVSSLISAISSLSAANYVDDAPKTLRPYGLETPRLTVAVTTETRKLLPPSATAPTTAPAEPQYETITTVLRASFGGSADDKVFARLEDSGSSPVFQIPATSYKLLSQSLNDLRDSKIAELPGRVQKMSVATGGQTAELVQENGAWKITGQTNAPAEFAAADDLIKAVRELSAIGFEEGETAAFGFDRPKAVIQMTVEGKTEPVKITIGNRTPSGTGVYVRNDVEGFVAVAKADAAEALAMSPAAFMDRGLLTVSQAQVTNMDLTFEKWRCSLRKEGGQWRFVSPVEGAVENAAVSNILSDLSNLRGRRVVGVASQAAEFGLNNPTVRAAITVQPPPPPPPPTTTQTSQPAEPLPLPPPVVHNLLVAAKDQKVYAMIEGGATICEIDAKVLDDLRAELFDTRITTIDPTQAARVRYGGSRSFAFQKDGDNWRLEGEPTFASDPAKINAVFNALRDLKAKHYERYAAGNLAEFGLDKPEWTIDFETADGASASLLISATGPGGGDRYATVASSNGRVFVMKAEDVAKFTKQLTDFQSQS